MNQLLGSPSWIFLVVREILWRGKVEVVKAKQSVFEPWRGTASSAVLITLKKFHYV